VRRTIALAVVLLTAATSPADDVWTDVPPPRRVGGTVTPPPPPPTSDEPLPPWAWLLIGLGAGAGGIAAYRFGVEPRRKRKPFLLALDIMCRRDEAEYDEAERLFTHCLTLGLRPRDVAAARFQLAYLRARGRRYAEAVAVLSELAPGERDREAVYLEMWLRYRLKEPDRVEALYREHRAVLGSFMDARTIVSIVYLERGRTYWAAKQTAAAVEYFNFVRDLGVLHEEIPEHIDDHQLVLGVASIHEGNYDQAAEHFRGAVRAAGAAGNSTAPGRLGELVCTWRKEETPDIDEPLERVVAELWGAAPDGATVGKVRCAHPKCRHEFLVTTRAAGKRVACLHCRLHFRLPDSIPAYTDDADGDRPDRLLADDELLVRNALVWHAAVRVFGWKGRPPGEPVPAAEWEVLDDRLGRARVADPAAPDPDLLDGLLRYYFAADSDGREAAMAVLDRAVAAGVNLPTVLDLIAREKRVAAYLADGLARFYRHAEQYVGDGRIPLEYRTALYERLHPHSRFVDLASPQGGDADADARPSLEDLQNRSDLLRDRVQRVHRTLLETDPDGANARVIVTLVEDLKTGTEELFGTARKVERTEHELMASTSEFLLNEDDPRPPAPEEPSRGDADARP